MKAAHNEKAAVGNLRKPSREGFREKSHRRVEAAASVALVRHTQLCDRGIVNRSDKGMLGQVQTGIAVGMSDAAPVEGSKRFDPITSGALHGKRLGALARRIRSTLDNGTITIWMP